MKISNFLNLRSGSENTLEVHIEGFIGDSFFASSTFTTKDLLEHVKTTESFDKVHVYINSEGGSVFEGFAVYNLLMSLKSQAYVTVTVTGVAGSIASVIAMAGDEIQMAQASMMFIHQASAMTGGNADDLRDLAATLDKMDSIILDVYENRTNQDREVLRTLVKASTFFTPEEAVELGFADVHLADNALSVSSDGVEDKIKNLLASMSDSELGATEIRNHLKTVITDNTSSGWTNNAGSAGTQQPDEVFDVKTFKPEEITAALISTEFPAVAAALKEQFTNETRVAILGEHPSLESAIGSAVNTAREAETARIRGVFEASMPGHEELVNKMAFDGTTSPGDAALAINKAEREARASGLETFVNGSVQPAKPAGDAPSGGGDMKTSVNSDDTFESASAKLKSVWDSNKEEIQSQYIAFGDFVAFELASAKGHVRLLRQSATQ